MNKKVICFLKSQVVSIMVFKKLIYLFVLLFFFTSLHSNVIYKKNNIVITNIDIEVYIDLYKSNYGYEINQDNALKDLVLIKNLIENLKKNNNKFIEKIDDEILKSYGEELQSNENFLEFARFSKIRDEFTKEYFQNRLKLEELERLFSKLNSLELPISQNNCLIIEKILDFKDNKEFIDSLFYNLKNNKRDFYFFENGKKYEICLDDKKLWSIERIIINYIQSKTKDEFEAFVYANSKN